MAHRGHYNVFFCAKLSRGYSLLCFRKFELAIKFSLTEKFIARDNLLIVENQASNLQKKAHTCFALLEISVLFALIYLSSAILPPYIGGDLHH